MSEKPDLKNHDLLTLFSLSVAVYGLAQFFYVTYSPAEPNYLLLFAALMLLLFPEKPLFLGAFAAISAAQFLILAPLTSNHMMLAFLLWVYVALAWGICAARERSIYISPEAFYRLFAPPGRLLLLTMYFFGVFHKINSAFLNPDVSCASSVIDSLIILPEHFKYPDFFYISAGYGTLVFESLIAGFLIFPRTRYWGVVLGIVFHLLIAFSAFRYYVPFTLISVAMHFLFLDPSTLDRLKNGRLGKIIALRSSFTGRLILAAPLALVFLCAWFVFDYIDLKTTLAIWGGAGFTIAALVLVYDRPTVRDEKNYLLPRAPFFTLIAALFFLSCFSPYIGFKTGQTINMFANLETEGGKSNHYLIRKPFYLFGYQDDLVRIIETDDPSLQPLAGHKDLAIVGAAFENILLGNPQAHVTFIRHGKRQEIRGLSEARIHEFRKPWLFRKFVVFNIVNTAEPHACLDTTDIDRENGRKQRQTTESRHTTP